MQQSKLSPQYFSLHNSINTIILNPRTFFLFFHNIRQKFRLEQNFLVDSMEIFLKTCSAPRSAEHPPPRAGARARRAAVRCDAERSGRGAVPRRAGAAERRAGARGGGAEGCVLVGQGCAARGS